MINANMKSSQTQSSFLPPKYFDLGTYHRPITTTSEEAQTWFDRGLIWVYGFNHEEAAKCFEKAIAADEGCTMAYWGLAYALGPNYNKPWDVFDEHERTANLKRTHIAARQAEALSAPAEPVERALIHAIQSRYPQERTTEDFSLWNKKYAEAMESVYEKFSDDLDVAALYADALMNLTPWALWDIRTGEPTPGSRVLEAKQVLDQGIATGDGFKHPGLLHSYIHLMEMSSTPEKALTIADCLRDLVPDAGHLRHMPSHLDIMCGDYRRAIAANSEAILADERFVAREGPFNFYSLYRTHNYHFRIYAAMFSGQSKIALESVAQIEKSFPEELLRVESPPMADWLEGILSMRVHVFIRFGLWHDLLSLEFPKDQELYCVTTAMIYYGKGVAFAATGKVEEAEEERTRFRDAVKRVPCSRTIFANKCIDVLAVAGAMLDGELAYRQGNFDLAFEELRRSISLDDALPYDEPWGWMQPTRHAYGALLLEQGHVEEAATVYSADLGMDNTIPRALQHPNNVWALHGYHECLLKLGRKAEAKILEPQLRLALAIADVPIRSSCFCRLNTSS
ncbi:TPR domain protein [Hyaloscypha finlandica]|nr:TPR domain protein [Hyaloscypha finlandica]